MFLFSKILLIKMSSVFSIFTKNNFLPFEINPTTRKTLFDIRKQEQRLWIQTTPQIIIYPFSKNIYKPDSDEGSLTLECIENLKVFVREVDEFVITEFTRKYLGIALGSVLVTKDTIKEMFRPSIIGDLFRINVSAGSCVIFSDNMKEITIDELQNFSLIDLIIEPSYVWIMNSKIGITWNARQICDVKNDVKNDEINSVSETEKEDKKFSLDLDSNESDDNDDVVIKKVVKSIDKKFSLDLDSNESDDNDDVVNKKVVKSKKFSLDLDSNESDDNDDIIKITTKPTKIETYFRNSL
jgi:hypothetical protein